jgi:hypothetical protein
MAYANASWPNDNKLGGVTLKAAAAVIADTNSTAVFLGKGKFRVVTTWTTCEIDNNDELYHICLDADTLAAAATYYEIATLAVLGDSVATGRDADESSTGSKEVIVDNPYDSNVRVRTCVNGTVTTGCNFSVIAYPLGSKA